MTFYFTYGCGDPDETNQSYQGGWTEVEATSAAEAIGAYKVYHPTRDGILPCCSVALIDAQMGNMLAKGNCGKFCHDRIVINREVKS